MKEDRDGRPVGTTEWPLGGLTRGSSIRIRFSGSGSKGFVGIENTRLNT